MQTYKNFIRIAIKNIPSTILYFVIFAVIAIISTSQSKDNEELTYKDEAIKFTVFNRDNSETGEAIKEYLSEKNKYVEIKDDEETIRTALYYRDIYYAVVVPEGYEEAIKNGEDMELMNYKVPDSAMGYYMDLTLESYAKTLKAYVAAGYSVEEANAKAVDTMKATVEVSMVTSSKDGGIKGNPISSATTDKPAIYFFYQYVPYIFFAIMISSVGPIMITFGKKDIRRRVAVSSQSFKSYSTQMFLGVVTCGVSLVALFNVLSMILYGKNITLAGILCYVIITLCLMIVSMGITYLGGNLFSTTATMGAFSNVVSLGFSFLGGIFVPLEFLGKTMQNVAKFTPTYWYVRANDAIMGVKNFSDIDIEKFALGCGVQLLYAVAFFSVGLVISRYKREVD
ncbi:MAG: ABC transporter permease [Lachnospiraceae bacterium]|nr:ABC transporter permease [Lachnospiraceae bacterium]